MRLRFEASNDLRYPFTGLAGVAVLIWLAVPDQARGARDQGDALRVISKIVLHTDTDVNALTADYGICCRPVRHLLIRYRDERRPALDYKSLTGLADDLAGLHTQLSRTQLRIPGRRRASGIGPGVTSSPSAASLH